MLEIKKNDNIISVINSDKIEISFDIESKKILLDSLDISFPWEYEKGWVLAWVKQIWDNLFYSFKTENQIVVILPVDTFDINEENLSFLSWADVTIIKWSQAWVKTFENIESRIVVPYWEEKHKFLAQEWDHSEEVSSFKVKAEILDQVQIVNLA